MEARVVVNAMRTPQERATVVVVEDNLVAKLVRSVLSKRGYSVVVTGPQEAAQRLRELQPSREVLLTNSPTFFLEFAARIPLLYLTSSPDPTLGSAFRSCRIVQKPFAPNDLAEAVGELTGAR
jgi:CheY-like chemotaxis protein